MALLRNVLIFTFSVSFVTFVAFFGRLPIFRKTPIGWIHLILFVRIPSLFAKFDSYFTNGRIASTFSRLGNYLINEKHPLVIIFFLGLVSISAALFLPATWPLLPLHHKLLIPLLLPLPYLFTYLSAKKNSKTYITPANHSEQMRLYPYDRVLFYPEVTCKTCNLLKPARSKHCRICKTCVARMDHHCIWVNNCLGRGNYRWFLALLLSTGILLAYAAFLAYSVIHPRAERYYAQHERWYRYKNQNRLDGWARWGDTKWHYLTTYASIYIDVGGVRASGVGLLALLTWPLPLGLLGYHIYLIWAGMTTNENAKWADWRDDMADGCVFLGHSKKVERIQAGEALERGVYGKKEEEKEDPAEPRTSWPLESRHVLIRTLNGQPPTRLPERIRCVADEDSFERVWNIGAVENVYDLGFWDNLMEALR
ncbi:zf-DHHC-domain-containing protein [Westerdykella ornata]|uniref:Palmitoyltransferase n=1 Tax=Westerdykella ornata TaxID=318751 RepID=A0A6A6JVH6_WESOR|nr:zf-DHHC-domain-containing protein [Westerdykella ornata]KAF2279746.1 zf-DHHC-domain-containing protein [Westerdykella ornata]